MSSITDQDARLHHLYVEGKGQSLIAEGKLAGMPAITAKGISEYDQLLASGFRPKRSIVQAILERYHGVKGKQLDDITEMIIT